ncbi:hypothetical protein ACO0K3_16705 [Undibacterium sp. Rencai35W]|uniref:hypothetical protein n=1 Tax=Undibacterium sp. Rencai35W TaxID=3413046 RepID=UPI003BF0AEA1
MTYSEVHWKLFNFLTRRVMAVSFVVGGSVMAVLSVSNILPGGMVLVNGIPSDDLVFRWVTFLLPLLLVPFGVALFKVAPFVPRKKRTITRKKDLT